MTVEIELTQGKIALIDDADWELVRPFKWRVFEPSPRWRYAVTNARRADGRRTTPLMHRLLLGLTDPAVHVDHINADGLDNRRANLRTCSHAENMRNRRLGADNTSGFKGVDWHKATGKWRARLKHQGKSHHLGYFDDPAEAHAAYCRAADELHGDFKNYGV